VKLLAALLLAQTLSPAFDTASIKVNNSAPNGQGGGVGIGKGGAVSGRNLTLEVLITLAYHIADYQLAGLPAWATSTRYDVDARPEHAVDPDTARLMVRTLLAERCRLQVHEEQAAVNGFRLTVDKGGAKLKASEPGAMGMRISFPGPVIQGAGDMPGLISLLSGTLRAPVEDHTGLAGKYNIDLRWTPDPPPYGEPPMSIFVVIKERLGLSLDATKINVRRVVIDHVERPTEN
jgi:uncharacterized protein (TIGR03435 family)